MLRNPIQNIHLQALLPPTGQRPIEPGKTFEQTVFKILLFLYGLPGTGFQADVMLFMRQGTCRELESGGIHHDPESLKSAAPFAMIGKQPAVQTRAGLYCYGSRIITGRSTLVSHLVSPRFQRLVAGAASASSPVCNLEACQMPSARVRSRFSRR